MEASADGKAGNGHKKTAGVKRPARGKPGGKRPKGLRPTAEPAKPAGEAVDFEEDDLTED